MDFTQILSEKLNISKSCVRESKSSRFTCLVQDSWVHSLINGKLATPSSNAYEHVADCDPVHLLAKSTTRLPPGWTRVSIQVVEKSDDFVKSLVEQPLCGANFLMTHAETIQRMTTSMQNYLWLEARQKYKDAIWPVEEEQRQLPVKKLTDIIRELLRKLYRCPMIALKSQRPHLKQGTSVSQPYPGLLNPHAIIELDMAFLVVFPFEQYSLWDCITFSSAKLQDSSVRQLFVFYQILQSVRHCHRSCTSIGDIHLQDLNISDTCWIKLSGLPSNVYELNEQYNSEPPASTHVNHPSRPASIKSPSEGVPQSPTDASFTNLPSLVQRWMLGKLSNFDYLMALNHLAGRRMFDPNHHPIMPWVMDLRRPEGSFRDLTKSKYRLNKGDHQLDVTYNPEDPLKDPLQVSHHIAEVLSDITYYVYKARRIPKSVLCTHVRQRWVPHEYPTSMERLQEWTPDECIPEFYTDPEIFLSIHEDLPDLEVPAWANSPKEFVDKHRQVLEGDYVSQRLHHWIDLTFGYKLTGPAAVKAKNVCLQLVDQHTNLLNHGVVQLFNHPHPPRIVPKQAIRCLGYELKVPQNMMEADMSSAEDVVQTEDCAEPSAKPMSKSLTDSTTDTVEPIILPQGFQPVAALNHLEALYEFSERVTGKLPEELKDKPLPVVSPHQSLVMRDMQVLGCLLVEMFLPYHTRCLGYGASLEQRYSLCRSVIQSHAHEMLRSVRPAVDVLLQTDKPWSSEQVDTYGAVFHYDAASQDGQPPPDIDLLLHSSSSVFRFPQYFRSLYWVLHKVHSLEEQEFKVEQLDINILDKIRQIKRISKQKVYILGHYLAKAARQPGFDGAEILIPYVTQLIDSPVTGVQATWSLFNPVAQILGPAKTETHLLKLLQKLFDSENTTAKFIKIYHRGFVLQLIVRFGLESFLQNFVSYLIEAIGRYKNFVEEDFLDRQVSTDTVPIVAADETDQNSQTDHGQASIDSVEDALIYALEDEEVEMESNTLLDEVFEDGLLLGMDDRCPDPAEDMRSLRSSDTAVGDEQSLSEASGDAEESCREIPADNSSNAELTDELLGKSLGRLSVHSVSHLIVEGESASEGEDVSDSIKAGEEDQELNGNSEISKIHRAPASKISDNGADQRSSTAENTAEGNQHSTRLPTMVRSETDDFSTLLSGGQEFNISDVASETIKWLAHRLGPVVTAKHLSRNLLRMLMLCYMGEEQLQTIEREGDSISASERRVVGDVHAAEVLECLSFIVVLYGEQVVLLQYFQHVRELIQAATKKLTVRTEAGLVSCVALLIHIIPYLSDATLMSVLKDTIFGEIMLQIMKLVSSTFISFPSGWLSRSALCYKLVDVLYIVSLRIGFEMTREHMTYVLQKFFAAFNRIYEDPSKGEGATELTDDVQQTNDGETAAQICVENLYCELKVDKSTKECHVSRPTTNNVHRHRRQGSLHSMLSPTVPDDTDDAQQEKTKDLILDELKETFTPELAHTAYIPFCKLAGGIYLEQNLINEELIRNLCMIHDQTISQRQDQLQTSGSGINIDTGPVSPDDSSHVVSGSFGRNVSFSGNQIVIQEDESSLDPNRGSPSVLRRKSGDVSESKLRNPEMKLVSSRHLKGNWLAYWEHEVGLGDREAAFNFKQIKLQSFIGHTSSVRAIHVLNNENSFVSASKDKTVKLWSLRNWGDGQAKEEPKWTYKAHKKSVFAVTFLEASHLLASCDSNVHIWDPFMERTVSVVESPKNCPVIVMSSMPPPTPLLITVNADGIIRFLDSRNGRYSHEYKCSTTQAGVVRCLTVSPSGRTMAVGYSTGVISTVDIRTGALMASWKGHEGEILQIKAHSSGKIVTSCFDQTMSLWNAMGDRFGPMKGPTEPVHCIQFYKDALLSATTGNKVGVHGAIDKTPSYTCSKLRNDVFRGVLTTMAVLPLNRSLLLGADNGEIRLVA